MTIRILADREPYASFADASQGYGPLLGPPTGSIVFFNGPADLDEAAPDIVVLPAADFLALPRCRSGPSGYIAYGPVALMDRAFDWGCADYIREPWSMPELLARLGRLQNQKFRSGARMLSLTGSVLKGEKASVDLNPNERAFLQLLLRNAPLPVTREAAMATVSLATGAQFHDLGRCAVSLKRRLEMVEPGSGQLIRAVRGFGYRFDANLCG